MQENLKFNGKSNKGWKSDAKRWQKRDIQRTPDYAVGSFCVWLLYDLSCQKVTVILHLLRFLRRGAHSIR